MSEDVSAGRLHLDAYVDTTGVTRGLQRRLDAETKNIRAKIKADLDSRGMVTAARKSAAEASKAVTVRLKAELDSRGLVASARAAAAAASQAAVVKIRAEVDKSSLKAAQAEVQKAVGDKTVNVDVDANTKGANANIDAMRAKQSKTPIKVPVAPDTSAFGDGLSKAGDAISEFSKIPAMVGGVYALGTAVGQLAGGLVSVVAAASSAVSVLAVLPNLVGVLGQGVGSLVFGFQGVGAAVEALGKQQDVAAKDAKTSADAQVAATRRIADARYSLREAIHQQADDEKAASRAIVAARQAVTDAIKQQARDAKDSARAIREAERNVAEARRKAADDAITNANKIVQAEADVDRAKRDVLDAERDLNDEREKARQNIIDLNNELRLLAGDETVAANAVRKAQENLQDVNWNAAASSQERRAAQDALIQAEQELARVQQKRIDVGKEAATANANGVENAPRVLDAKDTLTNAQQSQTKAIADLAEAQRTAAQQETADNQAIADAIRAVADERQKARERAVADAQATKAARDSLAQAQHSADDQARADAHNVEMAQRALADAQKAAADTANEQSVAQMAVANAFQHLSPEAIAFAKYIRSLMPRLYDFRNAVAASLLPPIKQGIEAAMPLLDTLQAGFVESAGIIGRTGRSIGRMFGKKTFNSDLASIMDVNNTALTNFAGAIKPLIKMLKDIAFVAGPVLLVPFSNWISTLADAGAKATDTGRKTGAMSGFFHRAADTAKLLKDIVVDLAGAIFGVGKAGQKSGKGMLESFADAADKWNEWANSDAGQKRMGEFFDAVQPVTEEIAKLAGHVASIFVKLSESNASPIMGFLTTLNGIAGALDAIAGTPGVGKVLGYLMTLAGAAGALGFVSGKVLGLAEGIGKIGKVAGGVSKVTGLNKLGRKIRDLGKDVDGNGGTWKRWGDHIRLHAAQAARNVADGAKRMGRSAANAGRSVGSAVASGARATGRAAAAAGRFIVGLLAAAARAAGAAAAAAGRAIGAAIAAGARVAGAAASAAGRVLGGLLAAGARLAMAAATLAGSVLGSALTAAFAFAMTPVGIALIIVAALAGALIWAYKHFPGFKTFVDKVFGGIKDAVGVAVGWVKKHWPVILAILTGPFGLAVLVISKHWDSIKAAFNTVKDWVLGVFKRAWAGLQKVITDPIGAAVDVFKAIFGEDGSLRRLFHGAVDAVGKIWDGLRRLLAIPIRGAIILINDFVIDKFNWLSEKLHGPHIDRISTKGIDAIIAGHAEGGPIEGYSPNSRADNILIRATADEHMIKQRSARRLRREHPGALEYMNETGRLPGFANGGRISGAGSTGGPATVNDPDAKVLMNGNYVSRIAAAQIRLAEKMAGFAIRVIQGGFGGNHVAASGSSHNYPGVVDIGPASVQLEKIMRQVGFAAWARNIPNRSFISGSSPHIHAVSLLDPGDKNSPQVYGSWKNSGNGLSGWNNDPAPHYQWIANLREKLGAVNLSALGGGGGDAPGGGVVSFLQSLGGKVAGAVKSPIEFLRNAASGAIDKFAAGKSIFGKILAGMPRTLISAAGTRIKEIFTGAKEKYDSSAGQVLGGAVNSGVGAVSGALNTAIVKTAAAKRGWTGAQWNALSWLVNKESGFRNTAQNPSSTAYGMFQFLDSTWKTVGGHKTSDPSLQTAYGLKYIAQRYGDPIKARLYHLAHNSYDAGGALYPGSTLAINNTGKTETVFTNDNIVAMTAALGRTAAALSAMTPGEKAAGGLPALVNELTLVARADQMPAMLQDANHELRVIRHGGVYAKRDT